MNAILKFSVHCLLTAVCLALASGCGSNSASVQTSVNAVDMPVPVDKSLTLEEYAQLGMPPIDRTWTESDLSKAADILTEVARKDGSQLPRYGSPTSGDLFQRMTATDYLDLIRNRALPPQECMLQASEYFALLPRLLTLYTTAYKSETASSTEMMEVAGSQVRVVSYLLRLTEQLGSSLDESQPGVSERLQQIVETKRMLGSLFTTTMRALGECDVHTPADRKRLIQTYAKTLPEALPTFTEVEQAGVIEQLRALASDPKQQSLATELGELLQIGERVTGTQTTKK